MKQRGFKLGKRRLCRCRLPSILLAIFIFAAFVFLFMAKGQSGRRRTMQMMQTAEPQNKTLVLYAFHECGEICTRNLQYFLTAGVWDVPDVDYVFVTNGRRCEECKTNPKLRSNNINILYRKNKGFDFGAYRAGLRSVDLDDYKYFVFLNDGVRGPLVTRDQIPHIKQWHRRFTGLINDRVKLVGPTISCMYQVHVQSHMFAVDRIGLKLMMDKGNFDTNDIPLGEKDPIFNVVVHSEFGATDAIMEAGYTIDSLMMEYSHFNWSEIYRRKDKGDKFCNDGENPLGDQYYHHHNVNPLEVVFSKQGGTIRIETCKKGTCSFDGPIDIISAAVERGIKDIFGNSN